MVDDDDRDFELEFYQMLEQHPELYTEPEDTSNEFLLDTSDGSQIAIDGQGRVALLVLLTKPSVRLLYEALLHLEDHQCPDAAVAIETFLEAILPLLQAGLVSSPELAMGMSMDEYTRKLHPELFGEDD